MNNMLKRALSIALIVCIAIPAQTRTEISTNTTLLCGAAALATTAAGVLWYSWYTQDPVARKAAQEKRAKERALKAKQEARRQMIAQKPDNDYAKIKDEVNGLIAEWQKAMNNTAAVAMNELTVDDEQALVQKLQECGGQETVTFTHGAPMKLPENFLKSVKTILDLYHQSKQQALNTEEEMTVDIAAQKGTQALKDCGDTYLPTCMETIYGKEYVARKRLQEEQRTRDLAHQYGITIGYNQQSCFTHPTYGDRWTNYNGFGDGFSWRQ